MITKPTASLDIHLSGASETYSPMIFGHFIEHFHRQVYGGIFEPGSSLSDEDGFREDVIEAMAAIRPGIVRWPGGCFVSSYHWLDGVGPERTPFYDKAWRVTDPNTFGTAEFIRWCERIGAEPFLCTNAGTGTAEEMSDWVEYCNLPAGSGRWSDLRAAHGSVAPLGVKHWSIGNENYGSWEMGAKGAQEWARLVAESAKMMRHVDEDLNLLTAARADLDWMLPLLDLAGDHVDMLSIHGYWDSLSQVDEPSDYLAAVARSLQPQQQINEARHIIGAAGHAPRIRVAFDEWNLRGWHHPNGNTPEKIAARDRNDINATYTMADALFSASFLATCLRHNDLVSMANIAPSVNTRGPLFVHKDGLVKRTTYHVMEMFATMLGDRVLGTSAGADALDDTHEAPVFDHITTLDTAGEKLRIALINRHPDADLDVTLASSGRPLEGRFPATVLTGPGPDAFNDVGAPDTVAPRRMELHVEDGCVTLPPHSLVLLEAPERGCWNQEGPTGPATSRPRPWRQTGRNWVPSGM